MHLPELQVLVQLVAAHEALDRVRRVYGSLCRQHARFWLHLNGYALAACVCHVVGFPRSLEPTSTIVEPVAAVACCVTGAGGRGCLLLWPLWRGAGGRGSLLPWPLWHDAKIGHQDSLG